MKDLDYDFKSIEPKWQKYWVGNKTFKATDFSDKPKYYALDMFPYPSGAGLHVGHPEGYTATDIVCRFKRMRGFNVLHPMGWDAFGLPAEQYALDTGTHPSITTAKNIEVFKSQIQALGFSYDWDREVNTTSPDYFKWTQWIFTKLHEKGLAYLGEVAVNWCPALGTVLSNEEVIDGVSERGGHPVIQKPMKQWMLRITAYAERLLQDLDGLDWSEGIKEMQRNWIGKSTGANVDFQVAGQDATITVYTTRPDTLFGATYMVLAPEHPLVAKIAGDAERAAVAAYVDKTTRKSDLERTGLSTEKSGVFTGAHAVNPVNGELIPIWIADYVLSTYGTGAIMAVPAHDTRDFEFAQTFSIPIRCIIAPDPAEFEAERKRKNSSDTIADVLAGRACWTGNGKMINSANASGLDVNGLEVTDSKRLATEWLAARGIGEAKVNYKLRDWLFSRQRYWGEPFPVVHMEDGTIKVLEEQALPLMLPEMAEFKPSGTGESPLANAGAWLDYVDPVTGMKGRRETNTMPQWAGSCWYYLRYIDARNNDQAWAPAKEKYWMPVDLYVGGAEHAVLHLLYSRFWHKVLFDLGLVSTKEPFQKLVNQGMILGISYKDGRGALVPQDFVEPRDGKFFHKQTGEALVEFPAKMSKSLKNVVNPDDVIKEYGADSMRLYEMFMGPLEAVKPWNTAGVEGVYRFLRRAWRLLANAEIVDAMDLTKDQLHVLHATIKKVTEDTETMNFNTAISQMMIFLNEFGALEKLPRQVAEAFVKLLAPYAPHLGEELWERLGHQGTIAYEPWPAFDPALAVKDEVEILVQLCGKPATRMMFPASISKEDLEKAVMTSAEVTKLIQGKTVRKVVCVPGRLVNIVAN